MKQTQLIMGMPITIEIVDSVSSSQDLEDCFKIFTEVDARFSTYKPTSEISQINGGMIPLSQQSDEMKEIFRLAEQTRKETNGFFSIRHKGKIDPSGIVKGWAIQQVATHLKRSGFKNFYVDAGGDIQTSGKNEQKEQWKIGIRNPFNRDENVKVIAGENIAVATSGTAIRGQHIYNPFETERPITDIVSLTIVADDILDADRFATAAFAMGKSGIEFIEKMHGLEGYMIDKDGIATYTSGFARYIFE